jgi:hypothetical protein
MYELVFWQYKEGIYLNHQLVYESLVEEEIVEGVEELPVTVILNRIASVFSAWEKVDNNSWKGAFQVKTTSQSIHIDCYGTEGKTMELLAATLEEFKCPCYDPQVPVRFDEMNE